MSQAMQPQREGIRQLDDTKAYLGLTPKQYAYCDARAAGAGKLEAYRMAYDAEGMADDDAQLAAWRLEQDARIPQRINSLLGNSRQGSNLVPQVERIEVSKDWVVQGIANLAQDKLVKANTRLAAYIAVGKTAGIDAFRDIVVHQKQAKTIEEIDAEIAAHLSRMIDVTPNQDPVKTLEAKPVNLNSVNAGATRDRRRKPVT